MRAAALPLASPATRSAGRDMVATVAGWAALWLAATAVLWWLPLNNDVSWQLWVARQLRGGAVFGRDIWEINPPLWFWEAMPASALADRLHLAAGHLLIATVTLRTVICLALTSALVPGTARSRALATVGLGLVLLGLPLFSWGEREHLALLGALPYAALIARRREGRVDPHLALGVGLFAAWGFALKPVFVLVPLVLEGWLLVAQRCDWRPMRVETAVLAAALVAYAAATVLFAPDWVTRVLPMARATYGDFAPPLAWLATRQIWVPFWIAGAGALLLSGAKTPLVRAALLTAAAFGGCYLIQGKGFPYHALPATAALCWALWLTLAETQRPLATLARRPLIGLALGLAMATTAAIGLFCAPSLGRLEPAVARLPRGSVVLVLSAHSWHAFPMVEDRGFVWPLGGGIALMPLPAILRHGDTPRGRIARVWTLDLLADALARCPADAILVDDPRASPMLPAGADYWRFVRSDPRLRAILARYRVAARADGLTLLTAPHRPGRCFSAPPPFA